MSIFLFGVFQNGDVQHGKSWVRGSELQHSVVLSTDFLFVRFSLQQAAIHEAIFWWSQSFSESLWKQKTCKHHSTREYDSDRFCIMPYTIHHHSTRRKDRRPGGLPSSALAPNQWVVPGTSQRHRSWPRRWAPPCGISRGPTTGRCCCCPRFWPWNETRGLQGSLRLWQLGKLKMGERKWRDMGRSRANIVCQCSSWFKKLVNLALKFSSNLQAGNRWAESNIKDSKALNFRIFTTPRLPAFWSNCCFSSILSQLTEFQNSLFTGTGLFGTVNR